MNYVLRADNGKKVVYESKHKTYIGVWFTWFRHNVFPAINPLSKLNWYYTINEE